VLNINSNGTPTISTEYCITLFEAI